MSACAHIKENILRVEEKKKNKKKKNTEMRDEWDPDRDSYLKDHFG